MEANEMKENKMSEMLEQILERNNMNLAYKKVKSKKGKGGIDELKWTKPLIT